MAGEHHVLATPTLVKDHPLPTRMLVGDMSDHVADPPRPRRSRQ